MGKGRRRLEVRERKGRKTTWYEWRQDTRVEDIEKGRGKRGQRKTRLGEMRQGTRVGVSRVR